MAILKKGNKTFSGAGTLVVEDYYKKNGTVIPCIVLTRNKHSKLYTDYGGTYETKHKRLSVTAHNELREESINLLNINRSKFTDYVDIGAGKHLYRVYIIKVNGLSRKYYMHNLKLFEKKNMIHKKTGNKHMKVPRSWRETDNIVHVPIKNIDFNKLGKPGTIKLKDIDNNSITLFGRTKKAIRNAKNILFKKINEKPIAKRKHMVTHKSKYFTNGTISFIV